MPRSSALLALMAALTGTAHGAALDMVKNGSFELDADGDGEPDQWRISSKVSCRIETQGAFDGKRCLYLKREEGSRYALATQPVRVKPDRGYRCRATIRAPRASHYLLVAYKPGLNALAAKRSEWAVYPEWTTLALDFRTEEQTTVYVGLLAYGKEVYWDQVELWEDDAVRIGDVSPTVNELPLPLTEAEERRGFLTFTRPLCANTSARHVPSRAECSGEVSAFSPAGEVETLMVMVHARRDLEALSARLQGDWLAKNGERVPAKEAELFRIGYTHRPVNTQACMRSPLLLLPCRPGDLAQGDVAQFAVRMDVPAGASAGVYETALEILVGDRVAATVPMELRVLDIKFVQGAFKNRYDQVPEARTVTAIANEGIEAVGELHDVWIAAQPGGGSAAALLRKVKANSPLDSFVGAPRDIRYVWEFDPASKARVADFGKVRARAAQLIAQLSR